MSPYAICTIHLLTTFYLQPVSVMLLVQVVYNVLILLDSATAMLVIREQTVIPLVVVTLLVQAAIRVITLQVNVLAILDTQESHVTLVLPITIEQVAEHAQVSVIIYQSKTIRFLRFICSLWL